MTTNSLRRVLEFFENAREGVSISTMAKALEISPGQLESMVEYWVRKGRVRSFEANLENCGSCGGDEQCPYVVALPRSYELVPDQDHTYPAFLNSCHRL